VSNNSYVFNKNSLIYVTGNVELNGTNSNFYLRNQGQLLQGTSGLSANKGTGKLSVFQEGTVNNFAYNYWCSPVGNASITIGNEDFGITMLQLPITYITSTPANITSGSYNGTSANGSLTIASYWIWKFLSSSAYSQWFQSAANSNISAGQGFTMKGTSGTDATNVGETVVNNPGSAQRYDFRGKPNDGNITVNVGTNNFTLTGNPYPSALHVNAFLLDATNSACTGIAYYWEQNKALNSHILTSYQGGYGTYSPVSLGSNGVYVPATYNTYNIDGTLNTTGSSSGLSIERKYAPIGQGFMVKGTSNGTLTLKNSHRIYKLKGDFSQFERFSINGNHQVTSDEIVSQIHLKTSINNQYTTQLALVFTPNATNGIDRGIDAQSPVDDSVPNDVYFFLDNDKYVIQGVVFDVEKRIPLGIKSTDNATFKFDASTVINFDQNQAIYLYDSLDGNYYNIKNGTHEVTLPSGIYNNRFELVFKDSTLNSNTNENLSLSVFQNNGCQLFTILNPKEVKLKSVKLFDITGKVLFDKQDLEVQTSYSFSTNALSEAVYLVEVLTNDNQKITRKIIVSSKIN
jgi:hypothetical protein